LEYLQHHCAWYNYRLTESPHTEYETVPEHCGFAPLVVTHDRRKKDWQNYRCQNGEACLSLDLYHVLIHHSGKAYYPKEEMTNGRIIIGFHFVPLQTAFSIARVLLQPSLRGWCGPGIYFSSSINLRESDDVIDKHIEAHICAKINLGTTLHTTKPDGKHPSEKHDSVYWQRSNGCDEFCVNTEEQILSWFIIMDKDPNSIPLQEDEDY
jgi:hypothetical protein